MSLPPGLAAEFARAASGPDDDLPAAALTLARLAYPRLDASRYLDRLAHMGGEARTRAEAAPADHSPRRTRLRAVTEYLFSVLGYTGNTTQYEDPRNSFLNDVLDRRTGIPITLAVVFMDVARRAGITIEGVNFPGHFLMRALPDPDDAVDRRPLLIDPFHGGAILTEPDCYRLLRAHLGDDAALEDRMFQPAGKRDMLLRMLLNLKRSYVRMRSFPQARDVAELVLALEPSALSELRDRGLIASQLHDYASALQDLQAWLALVPPGDETREERDQVWDHVKALRRRLAGLN